MWKKPAASSPDAWACRNSRHLGVPWLGRGAGLRPALRRVRRMVEAPTPVAEASKFALDSGVAPCRVLVGEAQDQDGEFLGDRWASGPGGLLFPLPAQQSAVPGQERAGGDEAVMAQPGREVSGEGGEHGAVRPRQVRPGAQLAPQHRDLVAQCEELNVLGILRPGQQQDQSEEPDEDQVEHTQRHRVAACHDHLEPQTP
jgi:hypothetical protein